MMDFNEETDILDRLGILDSKLKCPNKQFPIAKRKDKATICVNSTSCSVTALEVGDGWGGFSLDELSSSSDDSEFLFDHRNLNSSSNGGTRKHQGRIGYQFVSIITTPNLWKLFALLNVAYFAMVAYDDSDATQLSSLSTLIGIVGNNFDDGFLTLFFVWWCGTGDKSEGNLPHSSFQMSKALYYGFGILVISYLLFLLLLAKLRKSQRRQKITQLSDALNGNSQKERKTKALNGRSKGLYKELSSSAVEGESSDIKCVQNILNHSEESQESEEVADLEMESIEGDEGNDKERRIDSNIYGTYRLA